MSVWLNREWCAEDVGRLIEVTARPMGRSSLRLYSHQGIVIKNYLGDYRFQPNDWLNYEENDDNAGVSLTSSGGGWRPIVFKKSSTTTAPSIPSKEISTVNYNINTIPVIDGAFISQLINAYTGVIVWQSEPFTDKYVDAEKASGADLAKQAAQAKLNEVEKNLFA